MELFVDDAGFVRAPAPLVYRRLTDVAGWPRWWPGVRVVPRGAAGSTGDVGPSDVGPSERWGIELSGGRWVRLRLDARFHGWRQDTGVVIRLSGDVVGEAELWLEPTGGGTVVHHLLVARTNLRAPRRVHDAYRRAFRYGLWGLKDAIQLEARTMAGLRP